MHAPKDRRARTDKKQKKFKKKPFKQKESDTRVLVDQELSHAMEYEAETSEISCALAQREITLLPGKQRTAKVTYSRVINKTEVVVDSETAIADVDADSMYAATWGDGTDEGLIVLVNQSDVPMTLSEGMLVACATVSQGSISGRADPNTMEILALDDDESQEDELSRKFDRLEWLPITFMATVVFFSGPGGMEMGLKYAWDLYGASFKVVLAIDNDDIDHFLEMDGRKTN